ncbi:TIGR04255 family protein [Nocardia altamirensis]|uniref:TIGR04255 family protein n=1 Tax=Nocardia altamirensis TaxID=472158 RepID=UPI0009FE9CE1|nr:TIGR04255 family protein [Nocardia altamirensis]
MASGVVRSPFGTESVDEVPLSNPPLVRVLAQIRFAKATELWVDDSAARHFIAAMKSAYPIVDQKQETAFKIGPGGVEPVPETNMLWQLESPDREWLISFGDAFFALTSQNYSSRTEFIGRLMSAWKVFTESVDAIRSERIGIRYINRIADSDAVDRLDMLVRPEMIGESLAPIGAKVKRLHSIGEAQYALGEGEGFKARWGLLPPGGAFDPSVPTVDSPSWVLDLDAFVQIPADAPSVAIDQISDRLHNLATRAYRYFRWTVTDDFLVEFGGKLDGHS